MKHRLFFTFAITFLFLLGFTACDNANKEADSQEQEESITTADETGEWRSIKPNEIGDVIDLLHHDGMALAAGKEGDMNTMTIGWGDLGVLWGKPIFTVYVSTDRYTNEFMQRYPYFTVMALPERHHEALRYIGSHSGREGDKLTPAGLHASFTALGNPIFDEANLAIECRTIYSHQFEAEKLDPDVRAFYERTRLGRHVAYIGEIVNVWEK